MKSREVVGSVSVHSSGEDVVNASVTFSKGGLASVVISLRVMCLSVPVMSSKGGVVSVSVTLK